MIARRDRTCRTHGTRTHAHHLHAEGWSSERHVFGSVSVGWKGARDAACRWGVMNFYRGGEEKKGDCCKVKHTLRCCSAAPHPPSHGRMPTCMQRDCTRGAESAHQKPCTQPWITHASSRRSRAGRPPLWLAYSTATLQPSNQKQRHAEGLIKPSPAPLTEEETR